MTFGDAIVASEPRLTLINGISEKRVYEIVEGAQPGDRASEIFDIFIISLICLNVVALIVETVEEVH